jgi:hypothetical protein
MARIVRDCQSLLSEDGDNKTYSEKEKDEEEFRKAELASMLECSLRLRRPNFLTIASSIRTRCDPWSINAFTRSKESQEGPVK